MTTAPLPDSVRRRVVDVAADRLGSMDAADIPASLRPFARFTPARRRQVVLPLAAALDTDDDFRARVADGVREALPDLAAALESGADVPSADPDDVAAVAYLLRTPGWADHVARAAHRAAVASQEAATELAQRADAASRRTLEADLDALRAQLDEARAQVAANAAERERERRRDREVADRARRAEAALAEATEAIVAEREAWARDEAAGTAEIARLRAQLSDAQALAERLRRDTRDTREAADTRRWLLLDTLSRAITGLRDELGVSPPSRRPADFVAAPGPAAAEPIGLDALLALPNAHLIVDGYNVTKTGFPDLPLADQRTRLVTALAALAARTGAEVTCVFDGAEVVVAVPTTAAKRVRVRFSPPGQIADELIRRLVRAEPAGRPVTVCSADNEVVDAVRRSGARVVTPDALLARLTAR